MMSVIIKFSTVNSVWCSVFCLVVLEFFLKTLVKMNSQSWLCKVILWKISCWVSFIVMFLAREAKPFWIKKCSQYDMLWHVTLSKVLIENIVLPRRMQLETNSQGFRKLSKHKLPSGYAAGLIPITAQFICLIIAFNGCRIPEVLWCSLRCKMNITWRKCESYMCNMIKDCRDNDWLLTILSKL